MPDTEMPLPHVVRPIRDRPGGIWIAGIAAFVLGLAAAGWLGWRNGADFGHLIGLPRATFAPVPTSVPYPAPAASGNPARATQDETALLNRIAMLEQRLDQIDLRAEAASGNAARAEALLVAFAVRRVVERGAPLGDLADQLKLRFGDAQPNAVATIIADSKDVVPLDQLAARLETLAPQLTESGRQGIWAKVTGELAEIFVVRRDRPAQSDADSRLNDARMALSEGRIDQALADIQHLPQGSASDNWTAAARRYRDVERALDLIDTTAMLEPRKLHDATGNPVNQVSPLATTPAAAQ